MLAAYKGRSVGHITWAIDNWLNVGWPQGTTLEDAIDRIQTMSSKRAASLPKGIPIYVDPEALQRTGKTLKSPMVGLPVDPQGRTRFREKLRTILEPMGLACEVKDGAIWITTPDAIENPMIEQPKDEEGLLP